MVQPQRSSNAEVRSPENHSTLLCSSSTQIYRSARILHRLLYPSLCLRVSHASLFALYHPWSILTRSNFPLLVDNFWDQYVFSERFDQACDTQSRRHLSSFLSLSSQYKLGDSDGTSGLTSVVDSSDHGVSKLEAYLYYHGLRGDRSAPKLIYRTSTDIFSTVRAVAGPPQDAAPHRSQPWQTWPEQLVGRNP